MLQKSKRVYKGEFNNISGWLGVLVCNLKRTRKSDEQISMDVKKDHGTWISQKMQKRKVLEEPVPLQVT